MIKSILLGLSLLLLSSSALADVLLIEEVRASQRMQLPENGLTKSEVENRFGAPTQKQGSVGDPPISRWDYPDYIVYFEYGLVITSVLKHGAVLHPPAKQ